MRKTFSILARFVIAVELLAVSSFAGTLKDSRDGKVYKTVKIADQEWMAQNLNYKTGNSWCYDNDNAKCQKYGRLYDWKTAMEACPAGWHLPSESEFEQLQSVVGGESIAGKKLKSKNGWDGGGNGTDALGFAALPAGYRYDNGGFYSEGLNAYFWSSTENDSDYARRLILHSDYEYSYLGNYDKSSGFSVRCLKTN